ncbi:hypothetical protein BC940DRAFT_227203, partial [Gongronella butleri]
AHDFYQKLYTSDPVSISDIDNYLASIHSPTVSKEDNEDLIKDITLDELLDEALSSAKRSKESSPGSDGLGYTYLRLLFSFTHIQPLLIQIYNDALSHSLYPISWRDVRVRLLPKKGDLTQLKNWRPIALTNCDAKIFTRIL